MIFTDLKNAERLVPAAPGFMKALEFLRRLDIRDLPDGKYEIDGDRVFALVQRYETINPAEPKFEAHRKYIDVQFVASGAEIIGRAALDSLAVTEVYDREKDACFGVVPSGLWAPQHLKEGQLAVLYPEDAHAPRLTAGAPAPVIKIVIKVAVPL